MYSHLEEGRDPVSIQYSAEGGQLARTSGGRITHVGHRTAGTGPTGREADVPDDNWALDFWGIIARVKEGGTRGVSNPVSHGRRDR